MTDYQQYLDEKVHQLRIVSQAQWDYLKYSNVSEWLDDNFKNDVEGKYYATKILLHTIYYSKKDIEKLLNFGLYEKIYGETIKTELIAAQNIYISNSEAEAKVNELKKASFFVPLLDSNKPSESGNSVVGDLVHKLNISEKQVDFHWNITDEKLKDCKILIFVDDCVGSGNQLKNFWNSSKTSNLKAICKKYNIKVYFLVLLAYNKSIDILMSSGKLENVSVIVCDILTDKNRVFSENNNMWDGTERESAITYFEKIKKERGVHFSGYKNLDFAVILHDRLPNWSLPIFWKEMTGWKALLKRKSS